MDGLEVDEGIGDGDSCGELSDSGPDDPVEPPLFVVVVVEGRFGIGGGEAEGTGSVKARDAEISTPVSDDMFLNDLRG